MSDKLTEQQEAIIKSDVQNTAIEAYAGTGKTFTMTKLAQENAHKRILYIAYNRSISLEAQTKFPSNVTCITTHSMAYRIYGAQMQNKLDKAFTARHIKIALDNKIPDEIAYDIRKLIDAYMHSGDECIETSKAITAKMDERNIKNRREIRAFVAQIWRKMIDINDPFPATHDTYLKLYQLSKPKFDYDIILLDEAQDTNPCVMALVFSQTHARIVLVGDRHQSIYRFRGANNALSLLPNKKTYYLTQSFRFGCECAALANDILSLKDENLPLLEGLATKRTTVISPYSAKYNADYLRKNLTKPAILHRTVAECIRTAASQISKGNKVAWVGGVNAYNFDEIIDLFHLMRKDYDQIRDKHILKIYKDFDDYENAAQASNDPNMVRIIDFIKRHPGKGDGLLRFIAMQSYPIKQADVILCTAHRSKGLEWDNVILANDFSNVIEAKKCQIDDEVFIDEINLNYVAATRGMRYLANCRPIHDAIKVKT